MNDIEGKKKMTVREVADVLGCSPETIKSHIRELWPDLMKNGLSTYLTETQITLILEKMKYPVSSGAKSNLQNEIAGIETSKSLDLQIALAERSAKELWRRKALEQETRAIKAEAAFGREVLAHRETRTGLETYQRYAEHNGLALSDMDDVLLTYRGGK